MAVSQEARRLASRLRGLRESAEPGLTQAVLAKVFGEGGHGAVGLTTVSSWESSFNPKLPSVERLEEYALFFCTVRSRTPVPHLLSENDLLPAEHEAFHALRAELLALRTAARHHNETRNQSLTSSVWTFPSGLITVVCPVLPSELQSPLASGTNPNFTRMYQCADLDALFYLWGHIHRCNPEQEIRFRLPDEIGERDLSGNLVFIGGVGLNDALRRFWRDLADFPVEQIEVPDLKSGEIFRLRTGDRQEFRPQWHDSGGAQAELKEDVGLLARLRNPYSSSRVVSICNGIHSRGVLGAAKALTDTDRRRANEEYLSSRFGSGTFGLLMRVHVSGRQTVTPELSDDDTRLWAWTPHGGPDAR